MKMFERNRNKKGNIVHKEVYNIEERLDLIQKRCRERTISIDDIKKAIKRLESKFCNFKNVELDDTMILYDENGGDNFSRSYLKKGTPQSTQIMFLFKKNEWVIVDIRRGSVCSNKFTIFHKNLRFDECLHREFNLKINHEKMENEN